MGLGKFTAQACTVNTYLSNNSRERIGKKEEW